MKIKDDGENISSMEPLLVTPESDSYGELIDIAMDLIAKSTALRASLPASIVDSLSALVRTMNCYYSNLIEGHNTHPIDIERAMMEDYSRDKEKRDLQLEARAHVEVQQWLDAGALEGRITGPESIKEIHKQFCSLLPPELLILDGEPVVPGQFRTKFVQVGKHVAISPGAIERFLDRYFAVYERPSKSEAIVSIPAAHHRLLWIHPFMDGNGRVARLVSHAQILSLLETGGIWSVARGLARSEQEYKSHLMACDATRYNDWDGRGNLSLRALIAFTRYFLLVCVDQVEFMGKLIEPNKLRERVLNWTGQQIEEGLLPQHSIALVQAVLYKGELARSEAPALLGVTDRQARRVTSALVERGVLTSQSDKSPFKLAFPATLASEWMPGLFPSL